MSFHYCAVQYTCKTVTMHDICVLLHDLIAIHDVVSKNYSLPELSVLVNFKTLYLYLTEGLFTEMAD